MHAKMHVKMHAKMHVKMHAKLPYNRSVTIQMGMFINDIPKYETPFHPSMILVDK